MAKEAEKCGWDGFFLWNAFLNEEKLPMVNSIIIMSAIASQTSKIKLGFMVVPLPFYKIFLLRKPKFKIKKCILRKFLH